MEKISRRGKPRSNNGGTDDKGPSQGGEKRSMSPRRSPKKAQTKSSTTHDEERLKAIGKKTREVLEQERSKRKEIVRINDPFLAKVGQNLDPSQGTKRSSTSTSNGFSRAVMEQTGKRRKTSSNSRYVPVAPYRKTRSYTESNVDQWFPYTNDLLKSYNLLPKCEKSNIVRLHGLPVGAKVEHILKFFSGLSPQRIFVLPTLDETIEGFDVCDDNYYESHSTATSGHNKVKRHSNQFRVFVKFQSYPIANSSLLRSGETLRTDENSAAAIAVTPISKVVAVHLQKFMGIDGNKGDLKVLLDETEDKIPKVVTEILWAMFRKEVGIQVSKKIIGGDGSYPCIQTSELYNIFPPSTKQGQRKKVNLYNKLLDIYEELEKECTPLIMQEIDPYLKMHSSIHCLTITASMWILDQCDVIKKCLDSYGLHQYEEIESPI
mmetsp:Transcript_2678/g.3864  ORF Transcript_2678/g.3864 Transcript_2678/m.3864 type:complete len:434 (+) Transcript_2678:111-1412(+)|eukprot:CAMPEP_0203676064 /NCGR_PEP_ID=MMETSP0090-20130426/23177_1 /ASSEMBLY_ACC=CAM_ASM_001088 /TAXON_ID=426623 /ORGANISM="Chaetoceros affinis, Strain CCMP159" /LENGTH=433 /DNA_ID=CAMNT_0050542477 /DNA_START=53 /DNA_END=1354 /DNA_ORIENTATION=+